MKLIDYTAKHDLSDVFKGNKNRKWQYPDIKNDDNFNKMIKLLLLFYAEPLPTQPPPPLTQYICF